MQRAVVRLPDFDPKKCISISLSYYRLVLGP